MLFTNYNVFYEKFTVLKSETGLTSHHNNVNIFNTIKASNYFKNRSHIFHKHAQLIIIGKLNCIKKKSTKILKQRLKVTKNSLTKRLKTVTLLIWIKNLLNSMKCSTSFVLHCFFYLPMDQIYNANVYM